MVGHPGKFLVSIDATNAFSSSGTFREGLHAGYVLKQLTEHERRCCELLQTDLLKDFVPKYNGTVKDDEGKSKTSAEKTNRAFCSVTQVLSKWKIYYPRSTIRASWIVKSACERIWKKIWKNPNAIPNLEKFVADRTSNDDDEFSSSRQDLYRKMIAIDPNAPTDKEKEEEKILKPRYMIWRESLSSSQELGFRIEAIKVHCRSRFESICFEY